MKVSCLTATYGRFEILRECVSCFLAQDYADKELIILNNHPTPIQCDLPQVTVVNRPGHPTLGDCRNALVQMATGDVIRTWDDDDLYMPWTLRQGVENIGDAVAFKPQKSWFSHKGKPFSLAENAFEAAMIVRREVALKYGYKTAGGDEHSTLLDGIAKEGGCKTIDFGVLASYIYKWGYGMWHISGSLGSGTVEKRTADWKDHNTDAKTEPLTPVSVQHYWDGLLADVMAGFGIEDYTKLRKAFDEAKPVNLHHGA